MAPSTRSIKLDPACLAAVDMAYAAAVGTGIGMSEQSAHAVSHFGTENMLKFAGAGFDLHFVADTQNVAEEALGKCLWGHRKRRSAGRPAVWTSREGVAI